MSQISGSAVFGCGASGYRCRARSCTPGSDRDGSHRNRNATMQLYVSAMFEVTRTVWNEVRVLRGPGRV